MRVLVGRGADLDNDIASYTLLLGLDENSLQEIVTNHTPSSFTTALEAETSYYWQVVTIDSEEVDPIPKYAISKPPLSSYFPLNSFMVFFAPCVAKDKIISTIFSSRSGRIFSSSLVHFPKTKSTVFDFFLSA